MRSRSPVLLRRPLARAATIHPHHFAIFLIVPSARRSSPDLSRTIFWPIDRQTVSNVIESGSIFHISLAASAALVQKPTGTNVPSFGAARASRARPARTCCCCFMPAARVEIDLVRQGDHPSRVERVDVLGVHFQIQFDGRVAPALTREEGGQAAPFLLAAVNGGRCPSSRPV